MTARNIVANGLAWRFAPDEPPPLVAERSQAMLQARLIDEVLNGPPQLPLFATTTVHGAIGRATGGGRVGVVGRPTQAFFTPTVALSNMDLTVRAPGFLPITLNSPVGPQPGYPAAFAPVDLGDVAIHRAPTRIAGRIISRATGPLVGATVVVTGVWPVLLHPPGPATAPNAMFADAGLYADRPVGGTLRRRNLTPAAAVKTLVRPAVAGDTVVRLSDRQAIAAGHVLAIDFGDPGRAEFIGITTIDTGSSADQPADFTLDLPIRREHLEGATSARALTGVAGPANAINRAARASDVSVWTAALAGIGPASTGVEISGGTAPAEFHAAARYVATTNGAGDYALPPIHRIAALELTVSHAALLAPVTRTVALEWGVAEQIEDFVLA